MNSPTPELLAFFKTHGRPSTSTVSEAADRCARFLAMAASYASDTAVEGLSVPSKLNAVDEACAMCTGAVYSAYGMTLTADEAVFKHPDALAVLAAELELSEMTYEPLRQLRARAAELSEHPFLKDSDAFMVHQGSMAATALVEWTAEHTAKLLTH